MKIFSYKQLQIRIVLLIFIIFFGGAVSYRVFIERPLVLASMVQLELRELISLKYQVEQSLKHLQRMVSDYANWNATYRFVEDENSDYIKENYIDITFENLRIDGVFILDSSFNVIYQKGYNYKTAQVLSFEFLDLTKYLKISAIPPLDKTVNGVAESLSGVISTQYGAAFFSSSMIRKSDKSGEHNGFMIFLQLIDSATFAHFSAATFTNISAEIIHEGMDETKTPSWLSTPNITHFSPTSLRIIEDLHGEPLLLLTMQHSNGSKPSLLDDKVLAFSLMFLILTLVIFSILSRFIILPLKQLSKDIKSMKKNGSLEPLTRKYSMLELRNLSRVFNLLIKKVNQQNNILYKQTRSDPLTSLSNRRSFDESMARHSKLFIREKISFSLLMIDVDHFKNYNDHFGHADGDKALIKVAKVLQRQVQRKTDCCARYGGEEFAIIFSNINEQQLIAKIHSISASFVELNLVHPTSPISPFLTVTLGACIVCVSDKETKSLDVNSIIKAADEQLYQAKRDGRNRGGIINYY